MHEPGPQHWRMLDCLTHSGSQRAADSTGKNQSRISLHCGAMIYAVALALAFAASGQAQLLVDLGTEDQQRLQLFNDCLPMTAFVATINQQAEDLGFDRASLEASIRRRLAKHGLYSNDVERNRRASLGLSVYVLGDYYLITLNFVKVVGDLYKNFAPNIVSTGIKADLHQRGEAEIRESISEALEEFITSYRQVNEPSCASPGSYRDTPR